MHSSSNISELCLTLAAKLGLCVHAFVFTGLREMDALRERRWPEAFSLVKRRTERREALDPEASRWKPDTPVPPAARAACRSEAQRLGADAQHAQAARVAAAAAKAAAAEARGGGADWAGAAGPGAVGAGVGAVGAGVGAVGARAGAAGAGAQVEARAEQA